MSYKIVDMVGMDDIPGWERQPPKWSDLVEKVLNMEPGQVLKLTFDDAKTAERARNAVRDAANLKARAIIVKTRVVKGQKSTTLYLARQHPVRPNK